MARAGLADMAAVALRAELARGAVKAADLADACLKRLAEREGEVQAFAHVDPAFVMRQAEAVDRFRGTGRRLGALHGLPVGIKDIVDTRDFPTENGTPFDEGRRPSADAALVERLREAGAILFGKTVTTELAAFTPGKTRNPHDASRTPGGSSSGSAAAVAAGMVPLAIGSQTNGSVLRPASYCGVVGFKPTRGLISRRGVLAQSATLDQMGVFARSVEDAALVAEAIAGHDDRDPATVPSPRPDLLTMAAARPPVRPSLAFVRSPVWDMAADDTREGLAELVAAVGGIEEVALPEIFGEAHRWHRFVNMAELAWNYARYYDHGAALLSERMRGMVEEGRGIAAVDYQNAVAHIATLNTALELVFERYDAIITPAAPGEAPVGTATGDPAFNTIWTYCGVPAVSLPLLNGAHGMPIGVQLVGPRHNDGRLLRTARWLVETIGAEAGGRAEDVA